MAWGSRHRIWRHVDDALLCSCMKLQVSGHYETASAAAKLKAQLRGIFHAMNSEAGVFLWHRHISTYSIVPGANADGERE